MAAKVDEHGGRIARYQGDGFKAVFGLPIAQENDARQAVRAGLAIQDEAAAIAAELEKDNGLSGFQVQVGITTGMVFAGGATEGEDTIKGPPVNLAARLESAAEPGTILISQDTFTHVRGIFDLQPLESIQAKGFSELVPVYLVLRVKPRVFYQTARGVEGVDTRMVGRDGELKVLQDAFELAHMDRQLQTVTLVGDAGIGKSRLLFEFESWVDLEPVDAWLFRGRASQETQTTPYGLLRNLLAFRFEIQEDQRPRVLASKLLSGLAEGLLQDNRFEMKAQYIAYFLGFELSDFSQIEGAKDDPELLRDRAVLYLFEYFERLSKLSMVLILLEDIHWADDSSLDVINELISRLTEQPLVVINAARMALYEQRPYWGEGQTFHTRVDLRPLSKLDSRRLIRQILQKVEAVPDSLRDRIVENAQGNPFYLEELVKMLVERGGIEKGEESWQIIGSQLEQIDVPQTLTGVLQARLDLLEPRQRVLLQQASVVGRVFWDLVLVKLQQAQVQANGREQVLELLHALRDNEFVYRRETSTFGEAVEYIFKHDVLREVTLESVLLDLRRQYHSLAADWLIENRGKHSVRQTGLLAGHLVGALRKQEAIDYLRQAGEEAASTYAHESAANFYTQSIELVPKDDLNMRWAILFARERIFDFLGARDKQGEDLVSLESLATSLGEEKISEALLKRAQFAYEAGDYLTSIKAAKRVATLSNSLGNRSNQARAHLFWGMSLRRHGKPERAKSQLEQSLRLASGLSEHFVRDTANAAFGMLAMYEGELSRAMSVPVIKVHRIAD